MRRVIVLFAAMLLALATLIAPASAHQKDVTPEGQGDGHEEMVVSKAWAQAHCNAAAPEQATASSDGVVTFSPAKALPCEETPNPGGQVHPNVGDGD